MVISGAGSISYSKPAYPGSNLDCSEILSALLPLKVGFLTGVVSGQVGEKNHGYGGKVLSRVFLRRWAVTGDWRHEKSPNEKSPKLKIGVWMVLIAP